MKSSKATARLLITLAAVFVLVAVVFQGAIVASGQGSERFLLYAPDGTTTAVLQVDTFTDSNNDIGHGTDDRLRTDITCQTLVQAQITYLKFNVSAPKSDTWKLSLYRFGPSSRSGGVVGLYAITDDAAVTDSMTTATAPSLGTLLDQQTVGTVGYVGWVNFTINGGANNFVNQQIDGDLSASFAIQIDSCADGQTDPTRVNWFASSENEEYPGPLSVILSNLEATAQGRTIAISWDTASEVSNEGFNLFRSDAEDGEYVKINDALIPAQGNPSTGASYSFTDTDVRRGRTYYYKLEDVDTSGNGTFHGPVSATLRGKGR